MDDAQAEGDGQGRDGRQDAGFREPNPGRGREADGGCLRTRLQGWMRRPPREILARFSPAAESRSRQHGCGGEAMRAAKTSG